MRFWASVGPGVSHTAYASAKFAVKGFTEALMNDLRLNAPHIKCSVVMPGHIGTSILSNSRKIISGTESDQLSPNEVLSARQRLKGVGIDTAAMSDDDIQKIAQDRARSFRDEAPTSAAAAAKIILDGVKAEQWRILVGDDAHISMSACGRRRNRPIRQSSTRALPRKLAGGWDRPLYFDAFSSREPVSTSLENAIYPRATRWREPER